MPTLQAPTTNKRLPVSIKNKVIAFLMAASIATSRRIENQFGVVPTMVQENVHEVPRAICRILI